MAIGGKIDKQVLYDGTNGGLDVIRRLYPECEKGNRFVHFKIRNEDTPSANVFKGDKGIYLVNDHGSGDKPMNPIDLVMHKHGLSFIDACKWIAQEFNLNGFSKFSKPGIEVKEADPDQKAGQYIFEYKDFTEDELKVLGPLVTAKVAEKFNFKSCVQFIQVKQYQDHERYGNKLMQIITRSTDQYPVFVIDEGSWQKVYQPLHQDKKYRFRYVGTKPKNHVFGLKQLQEAKDKVVPYEGPKGIMIEKLDEVIIASGDRDALNVASLDIPVVWQNSETAELSYDVYKVLSECALKVYYMGDIDQTGIQESMDLAKKYIDINIIWLPEWLKDYTYRGKAKKDFKDYVDHIYKPADPKRLERSFRSLRYQALPARFWKEVTDKDDKFLKYSLDLEALYRFYKYNGYYRFEEKHAKEDFSFVKVEKGIVDRVLNHQLVEFPTLWLKKKQRPVSLVNFMHSTSKLGEKSLAKLEPVEIEFKDCSFDHQLLFFENQIWKVTKDGVTDHKYGELDNTFVWRDKILPHKVKVNKEQVFKITKRPNGTRDIEILRRDNLFFNYLINSSRVHWRVLGHKPFEERIAALRDEKSKQYEEDPAVVAEKTAAILAEQEAYRVANHFNIAEKGLSADQIQEQKEHLINKIFAMGYLMHKQKSDDKPWCVFAMDDNKGAADLSESHGGSGKSLMLDKAIRAVLLNNQYKPGRDPELFKNKHLYEGITKHTDYVLFDDLNSHFPFQRTFSEITGDLSVNPKHGKQYELPFLDSPKFAMTSNFALYNPDPSMNRRLLYTVFSDYYHYKGKQDRTEHKPTTDLGKMLFTQFDQGEWSDYFNLAAEAISFFLTTNEKIDCPLDGVDRKNALLSAGPVAQWADNYFADKMNEQVLRTDAFDDYVRQKGGKKPSAQSFKKQLGSYCDAMGYTLNPVHALNDAAKPRNFHTINGISGEYLFIEAPGHDNNVFKKSNDNNQPDKYEPEDDLPF